MRPANQRPRLEPCPVRTRIQPSRYSRRSGTGPSLTSEWWPVSTTSSPSNGAVASGSRYSHQHWSTLAEAEPPSRFEHRPKIGTKRQPSEQQRYTQAPKQDHTFPFAPRSGARELHQRVRLRLCWSCPESGGPLCSLRESSPRPKGSCQILSGNLTPVTRRRKIL